MYLRFIILFAVRDLNVSDRKVMILMKHVRQTFGAKAVISNTQDLLLQRKAILNVFFDNKILDFEVKMDNHDELPLPFTYCKDLPGLIQFCQMRWGLSDTVNEIERKEIKEIHYYMMKYRPKG